MTDQTPSLIVRVDGDLTHEAAEKIKARFLEAQKHGRIEVLPEPPPASLAEALARLQTQLPAIAKNAKAQYGNYADLADVSRELLPKLGALGLSFSARPTWVIREDGSREFVLAYRLRHVSGESDEGEYPLGEKPNNHQQLGSAITYGRRYCLCAITGAVAEDDDDGQAAAADGPATGRQPRARPPQRAAAALPRNSEGKVARSQVTDEELDASGNMTAAQQRDHNRLERDVKGTGPQGTERLAGTPEDDPWLLPAPIRTPQAAAPTVGVIHQHFKRLLRPDDTGQETSEQKTERLGFLSAIVGRKVGSVNDLTAVEGIEAGKFLGGCRDRDALIERLAVKAGEDIG